MPPYNSRTRPCDAKTERHSRPPRHGRPERLHRGTVRAERSIQSSTDGDGPETTRIRRKSRTGRKNVLRPLRPAPGREAGGRPQQLPPTQKLITYHCSPPSPSPPHPSRSTHSSA